MWTDTKLLHYTKPQLLGGFQSKISHHSLGINIYYLQGWFASEYRVVHFVTPSSTTDWNSTNGIVSHCKWLHSVFWYKSLYHILKVLICHLSRELTNDLRVTLDRLFF